MADGGHQTRRQRRAKHKQEHAASAEISMAQPDRSGPKGKSLMDLAAERQAELTGVDVRSLKPEVVEFPTDDAHGETPLLTACLYSVTLSMVHFTLDVAVYHQYAQEIEWDAIIRRIATILPAFAVIVFVLHLDTLKKFNTLRQSVFCVFSCLAGAYLVRTGNKQTYIAVMKRAPPLGTLLVWSFVEMNVLFDLTSLAAIAFYVWWNGFSVM